MDKISLLPDETLCKILSSLVTKDVVRTMFLSKRWKSLWMLVPNLEYDDSTHLPRNDYWGAPEPDYSKFLRFVDRSLLSRESQNLDSLSFKLGRNCGDGDLAIWIGAAVKRRLMELKVEYSSCSRRIFMPKCLFTCETLVILKLENLVLDVPELISLKSLKILALESMKYSHPMSLLKLLPNCPVLEDLLIEQCPYHDGTLIFKIIVPSLKRLSLLDSSQNSGITGLVIDTPSLKYLRIVDRSGALSFSEDFTIHEIEEADFEVILKQPVKLLQILASVMRLRLCSSPSEVTYPVGSSFNKLKEIEVCSCKPKWLDLFIQLLEDSPNLQVIKIDQCHPVANFRSQLNEASSVPRCLSSNLEILEWNNYEGTEEEKQLSTYILKTAVGLKKASFTSKSRDPTQRLKMLQELSLSPRISSTCKLVFN